MIANDLEPDRLLRITWYIWLRLAPPKFRSTNVSQNFRYTKPLSEIPPSHTGKEMFIKIESDNHKHDV